LLQLARFGQAYWRVAVDQEFLLRLAPAAGGTVERAGRIPWLKALVLDAWYVWVPALLVVGSVPAVRAWRAHRKLLAVALATLVMTVALTVGGPQVYPRYTLPLMPPLAAVLAAVLTLTTRRGVVAGALALAAFLASLPALRNAQYTPAQARPDWTAACEQLRDSLRPGETPVFVHPDPAVRPFPRGAFVWHASLPRSAFLVASRHVPGFAERALYRNYPPPWRGLAARSDLPALRDHLAGLRITWQDEAYAVWRSGPGARED
jgi:hypothetical protein